MIKEIREYFKSVIYEVDPDLSEHDQYFTSDDVGQSRLEDEYFLQFGTFSTSRIDSSYTGTFEVTLELWKNGKEDIIARLDDAYEDVIEIVSNLQDQKRISQASFLKSVVGSNIVPEAIPDNANYGKFTAQFTVTVGYQAG